MRSDTRIAEKFCWAADAPATRFCIEVWDSGVGIMGDQLPHVFEEYYQGSEGVERGGLGLGLAIVKRLAEILDHKVDVSSTPGKGTAFSIRVPQGQQAHADAPQSRETSDHDDAPFLGTILVIEDEMTVRKALGALLRAKGIRATTVATGIDAVTSDQPARHASRFDIIRL